VTAHQSDDLEQCPLCGNPLTPGEQATRDILLRATLPDHIAAAMQRTSDLSPREQAVFELLGLGYDNRSLARVLDVSERTAKRHVTAILTKLGLESRLQAGLVALLTTSLRPRLPWRVA
jgi:DNA-binding NarL/FixJ family response regulator